MSGIRCCYLGVLVLDGPVLDPADIVRNKEGVSARGLHRLEDARVGHVAQGQGTAGGGEMERHVPGGVPRDETLPRMGGPDGHDRRRMSLEVTDPDEPADVLGGVRLVANEHPLRDAVSSSNACFTTSAVPSESPYATMRVRGSPTAKLVTRTSAGSGRSWVARMALPSGSWKTTRPSPVNRVATARWRSSARWRVGGALPPGAP
jgi:hypothetical protein